METGKKWHATSKSGSSASSTPSRIWALRIQQKLRYKAWNKSDHPFVMGIWFFGAYAAGAFCFLPQAQQLCSLLPLPGAGCAASGRLSGPAPCLAMWGSLTRSTSIEHRASLRSLLEMQSQRPAPRPAESESVLTRFKWVVCKLDLEKLQARAMENRTAHH